ncbi:glutamate receptor 1-like isoform X1 [Ostrinia furnacalis]|uniref:glutamate receptor 1-like isoform X1 n=2 Tax=Ostrinia furnacalis TaxID=93504 RepID=UPI00103E780E|nr:glutamate receptor 1-like isoform X1 [Ostrinia furnacalis]
MMKYLELVVFALFINNGVTARDSFTTNFIKHYILNEETPTQTIFWDLCWDTSTVVKLVNELSKAGFRSSTLMGNNAPDYLLHNVLFLVDYNCPNIADIIFTGTRKKLFSSPFRWLVLSGTNINQTSLDLLMDCPLLPNSDVVLAERDDHGYKMSELHRSSSSQPMIKTPRGYFNGTFIDTRPHRELFRRRRDVMGHPLTMANVIQDSNTTQYHLPRENRLELQFDSIAKICWMDVKLAFQMLNATPRYIFSHRWGYKQNGQWSGMINDLHTGKADLGTNCMINDKERLDVVTYTDMMAPFRVRFIFRQPPLSYVSNIFSLPFSTSVWVAIIVCAVVSTVTLYLASKWEANLGAGPSQLDGSIGDALLLTMSAVSQQGCFLEPRRISGRVTAWVFFAALMALYAAYSANIVVLLQAPSNSIKTLSQLAASKVTLAANDVDYNHFVFSLYNDPVHVTIYKKVDPEKGKGQFYDINEGVERIRQGLFAFHSIVEPVYRRIEDTFLETEKCDLAEVDFMNGFDPFVPVRKDSPYLELLRVAFKQIREAGLQSALVRRMQVPKPGCAHKVSAFSSVGILDLKPVLLFMLYGTAASVAILVLEILTFKLSTRNAGSISRKTHK